jgi:ribosome-associated protein
MQTRNKELLLKEIIKILDDNKAKDIVKINLENKSSIADYMVVASGTSSKHIQSISENTIEELKKNGNQRL